MPRDIDTTLGDTTELDMEISDDELAALALSADAEVVLGDDAVPMRSLLGNGEPVLPEWYMPVPAGRLRHDWRATVAVVIALGLVLVNAFAICVTYGFPEIP